MEVGLDEKTPTHRYHQMALSRRIAMDEYSNPDGVQNVIWGWAPDQYNIGICQPSVIKSV